MLIRVDGMLGLIASMEDRATQIKKTQLSKTIKPEVVTVMLGYEHFSRGREGNTHLLAWPPWKR
jgi:hypothetical protein